MPGTGACLVCGAPADPGYYVEHERPATDERDHHTAGSLCASHARALDRFLDDPVATAPRAREAGSSVVDVQVDPSCREKPIQLEVNNDDVAAAVFLSYAGANSGSRYRGLESCC